MKAILKRILAMALILCMLPSLMVFASAEVLYKEGDKGAEVMKIKDRMLELGYYSAKASHNQYNATMTERVKQLQKVNGLEQTGVIDQYLYDLIFSNAVLTKAGKPYGLAEVAPFAEETPADDNVYYKEGDKGDEVMAIKKRMTELGYYTTPPTHNQFNSTMTERVKQLQKVNGLEQTGIVDKALYELIFSDDVLDKNGKRYGVLGKGDNNNRVLALKERMRELMYFAPESSVDASFNDMMEERVKLLQETNGLEATGYVTNALYELIMSDDCLGCGDWHDAYYQVEASWHYALSGEKLYSLSAGGNMVIFVLDSFAGNDLSTLLRSYPEALNGLQDFTYYNNCDPRYIGTYPSVTHMLTGVAYEPDMMVAEWFQQAWSSEQTQYLYNSLHELGYEFRYYDNSVVSSGMKAEALGLVDNLIDLRTDADGMVAPVYTDGEFYEKLKANGLSVDQTQKKYVQMIHLRGAEAPYTVDAGGNAKNGAARDENIMGYLQMVYTYMDMMKAQGLYDDATIIITADHGDKEDNMQVVYFIKQSGETHDEMAVNTAPISHTDFVGTLLLLAGGDFSRYGTSIADWNPGDQRKRSCSVASRDVNRYPLGSAYSSKGLASHNVWKTYTYTGDQDELVKAYRHNQYKREQIKQAFQ